MSGDKITWPIIKPKWYTAHDILLVSVLKQFTEISYETTLSTFTQKLWKSFLIREVVKVTVATWLMEYLEPGAESHMTLFHSLVSFYSNKTFLSSSGSTENLYTTFIWKF